MLAALPFNTFSILLKFLMRTPAISSDILIKKNPAFEKIYFCEEFSDACHIKSMNGFWKRESVYMTC